MAKHQSTWQCAARRPKKVSSIATPHKRPRQMTAESEECQQSAEFFDGGVDECLPSSPEPSLEAETIVPAPVPRPHDPDHAVRKRMRVRFLDILRLNARRDEAALVSNGPIMSTDVPESQYDHDDDLSGASSEEELDRREDGDEVDRRTRTREEYENEYEHAVKVLREYVQRVFNPAQGPGLPAAKRKEVFEIVQLALSAGKAYPDITVLDLFPE